MHKVDWKKKIQEKPELSIGIAFRDGIEPYRVARIGAKFYASRLDESEGVILDEAELKRFPFRPKKVLDISECFDPYNPNHAEAWLYYLKYGHWPTNVIFSSHHSFFRATEGWKERVSVKVANEWLRTLNQV